MKRLKETLQCSALFTGRGNFGTFCENNLAAALRKEGRLGGLWGFGAQQCLKCAGYMLAAVYIVHCEVYISQFQLAQCSLNVSYCNVSVYFTFDIV